ncbi:4Fe-4S dicluster domain-containing protein [Geovibrio thiophilus]|uniref:4Fe-4S dicluster domain-containing protein n=1 Tax=Geovibrio thiophilus TaxID=139438 RepID=UPI0013E38EBD|nr:4Fe-4S dicluster domain-containing protein [Geovibrio thiophilus]
MSLLIIALMSVKKTFAGEAGGVLLRPPGAVAEDEFLARCNRCQKCVQVCPTRVILPASIKYGIVKMNTPYVSFKRSYCNSCLKCSEECPTGALRPVTKETLNIGLAVIVEKDCVAWDFTGCTVCVDKCPLKAIELDGSKRPVVIGDKCNGCGICEVACPAPSLRSHIRGKGIIVRNRAEEKISGGSVE